MYIVRIQTCNPCPFLQVNVPVHVVSSEIFQKYSPFTGQGWKRQEE